MDKKISQMTVKELKTEIRRLTKIVNQKISEYDGTPPMTVNIALNNLKSLGTGKIENKKVGLGFVGKKKSQLVQQARELDYFADWDFESPSGRRTIEAREQHAWDNFRKENPTWEYDNWRDMVEWMGSVGTHILQNFGYSEKRGNGQITAFYEEFKGSEISKTQSFGDMIDDVLKENPSSTPRKLITEVWKKIRNQK